MIYTSYYWKLQNGKIPSDFIPVQISRTAPVKKLFKIDFFIPSKELLHGLKNKTVSEQEFVKQFNQQLRLNCLAYKNVFNRLKNTDKNVVLLCYEADGKFCHRHLVAEFLNKHGIKCQEF